MSNLQIGLAISGLIVLIGLLIHGSWTSRKSVPRQAEPILTSQELDALNEHSSSGIGSIDPANGSLSFNDEFLAAQSNYGTLGGDASHQSAISGTKSSRPLMLDALIDILILIELEAPVSGEAALQAMPHSRRVGTKIFAVEGLNAETGEWEQLHNGRRYSAFQSGVQLANRNGALNEIEFSEFVMKTQSFADHFNATPEFPDMLEVISRARELDHFATQHDAQLSFTLKTQDSAWSPGYVHQHAAHVGFIAGSVAGRMVIPSDTPGNPHLLSLIYDSRAALADDISSAAINELSITLDVTHVPRSQAPFALMCQIAQQLAKEMDGLITDDNGQPLNESSMQIIHRDLEQLYTALEQRDLAAGSPQARRLFT